MKTKEDVRAFWGPRVSAMVRRRLFVLLLAAPGDTAGGLETATITSGVLFNDTAGAPVHAHGAGVVPPGDHPSGRAGQYFIVGTSQKMPPSWLSDSVNLYSSTDLQHWSFEAEIFHSSQITTPWQPTPEPYRMERPKILYNM